MSTTPKMIVLKSSDNETFEVEEAVAVESQTIKHMIGDDRADTCISLPNVTSKILAKVIEYCKKHVDTPKSEDKACEDDLKNFDAEFVKVDQGTLFDLILAANYLNIKSLLDLTCQTVADMIKGKTPEEIRRIFNKKIDDFTPEEVEEVEGFKMNLIYYDLYQATRLEKFVTAYGQFLKASGEPPVTWKRASSMEEVLQEADVISLHPIFDKTTYHLVNKERLSMMKKEAILVNCSRGPVIDEAALVNHLRENPMFRVGLDVFEEETYMAPGLAEMKNAIVVPHVASASK